MSLGRGLRSSAYSAITRVPPARLSALAAHGLGRFAIRAVQRSFAGGSVTIAGGAAGRLLLASDHLLITHPQGYGLVRGLLEPSVQEALRRHVAPGATVYDVGADIGFFSILGARLAGPSGRVEAFEAVPASAAAVMANASLNGFSTISVHNVAVSDHDGRGTLLIQPERAWSHLSDRGFSATTKEYVDVELISLDERITQGALPPPQVIKLDVEGSEIEVIRGLAETLRVHRPVLICELHETNTEVVDLFSRVGYCVENLDGTHPVIDAGPIHILARPGEQASRAG